MPGGPYGGQIWRLAKAPLPVVETSNTPPQRQRHPARCNPGPHLTHYREPARPLRDLVGPATRLETVIRRQGSKRSMTSRCAVLKKVHPSGKEATRTAQEHAGGRSRCNGVLPLRTLPLRTLPVEQPAGAAEPTGYWMTNLPATTPVADLVRFANMRWRIEHDHRELKHRLGLNHFEGRTWRGRHPSTSPSSPPPRPAAGTARAPPARPLTRKRT